MRAIALPSEIELPQDQVGPAADPADQVYSLGQIPAQTGTTFLSLSLSPSLSLARSLTLPAMFVLVVVLVLACVSACAYMYVNMCVHSGCESGS
jgi:hypothetical protein